MPDGSTKCACLLARGAGDPERVAFAVSILRTSPLDEVADAVAAYSGPVYVECVGEDECRWSPATRSGAYLLMRLLAKFLRCDYHDITVGFVTVEGWAVVADPEDARCTRHTFLTHAPADARAGSELIAAQLPPTDCEGQVPGSDEGRRRESPAPAGRREKTNGPGIRPPECGFWKGVGMTGTGDSDPGADTVGGPSRSGEKACPYCLESIKAEAIKCRFCGEFLSPDPLKSRAADTTSVATPTSDSTPAPGGPTIEEPRSKHTRLILVVLGVLGLALVVGGVAAALNGDSSKSAAVRAKIPTTTAATPTTAPATTTTTPLVVSSLPSGVYANGVDGTPHYFMSLTTQPDGTLSGSVSFLYQDGQTKVVFTFAGTSQADTATLTPGDGGAPMSMTFGPKTLQLGECSTYLQFVQSLSQCTFNYTSALGASATTPSASTTPTSSDCTIDAFTTAVQNDAPTQLAGYQLTQPTCADGYGGVSDHRCN